MPPSSVRNGEADSVILQRQFILHPISIRQMKRVKGMKYGEYYFFLFTDDTHVEMKSTVKETSARSEMGGAIKKHHSRVVLGISANK